MPPGGDFVPKTSRASISPWAGVQFLAMASIAVQRRARCAPSVEISEYSLGKSACIFSPASSLLFSRVNELLKSVKQAAF